MFFWVLESYALECAEIHLDFIRVTNVVLYTVPDCPLCEAARQSLRAAGVDFIEHDIVSEFSARRRVFKATRQNLVPVLETNEQFFVRPTSDQIARLFAL